jgi:hypothetical protein
MHLVHARRSAIVGAQADVDLIFGAIMKSCFDTLRGGSEVASAMPQASR